MSTSFIQYRGHGFWSFDPYTERLLVGLVDELDGIGNEGWTTELAKRWKSQASGVFASWMHLELDELLKEESRRNFVCDILRKFLLKYSSSDPIHQTGVLLLKLLNGEIEWTESSPPIYMVQ